MWARPFAGFFFFFFSPAAENKLWYRRGEAQKAMKYVQTSDDHTVHKDQWIGMKNETNNGMMESPKVLYV